METTEASCARSAQNGLLSRLSVIVPCLNEEAGIGMGLAAVGSLRRQGAEVILVDGGSSDDTVARAGPWVDRIVSAEPGRARQMNAGAREARGHSPAPCGVSGQSGRFYGKQR